MWTTLLLALGLVLLVAFFSRGRTAAAPVHPINPSKPIAPPRLGGHDEDEELTVAAKVLPRDESQRLAALAMEHATDEEDDDHTGLRRAILVNAVARTDAGLKRKQNEDNFLVLEDYDLFVVADGMGGHAGGEIASALATETIGGVFREHTFPGTRRVTRYRRGNELARALELANDAIRETAAANPELTDMGSTCVAARFSPGRERVYIAHAGDSRAYRIRDGKILQLTPDHTLAVEAGAKGALGAQLTRALGIAEVVRPEILVEDAKPADHYLLCSDGLTKMLTDDEIRDCVLGHDIGAAAKRLVALANDRGGKDNITVILVRVEAGQ